ncbi:MAG TPA: class I SAM-dependent methyltransferase [Anaerolineaceae bacterium]|nr:class I SAM-dependent methyltransferase [Anaerolineaceae bacterium]
MSTEKIQFKQEKETLLATLYARALESRSPDPILRDEMSEDAIRCIDYDFERLKVDQRSIAMRAKLFDLWTMDFLKEHPNGIVLNLGCGLDSRIYRINPPDNVLWFDIDFPEVIELRHRLFPKRAGYEMIGSSLANRQFLASIPHHRPAWIMLEGVTMYLTKAIMEPLLQDLTNQFPSGGIAFDAIGPAAIRMARGNRSIRKTGATFGGFSIDDPGELKMIAPKLEFVEDARTPNLPGYTKLPLMMRALVRVFDTFPSLRKLSRILRYRF